MTSPKNIATGK